MPSAGYLCARHRVLLLNHVQHLHRRLDGRLRLVGIQPSGAEDAAPEAPGDDRLHEGVRPSTGRNGDGVVGQHGEVAAQRHLVDLAQGTDKGIVLAVAAGVLLVFLAIDFHLERCHGLQAVGQVDEVALQLDALAADIVFEDVGDDVGQVFLRHQLFLVAQLDDAFGHLAHGFFVQFQPQVLEVLADVGLAGVLAQGILALAAEAFGQEVVAVEVALVVAVGMDARHLGENVLAHDGLVGRDDHAAVRLHHAAHVVQAALVDARHCLEVIFQDGLHRGERCVPGPLMVVCKPRHPLSTAARTLETARS